MKCSRINCFGSTLPCTRLGWSWPLKGSHRRVRGSGLSGFEFEGVGLGFQVSVMASCAVNDKHMHDATKPVCKSAVISSSKDHRSVRETNESRNNNPKP